MHINIDRIFTTVARNLGIREFNNHINDWIEWTYEAEKLIGSRDTFVQKESTYSASGAKATGTVTFTSNPESNDSITLNGVKIYFRSRKAASGDQGLGYAANEIGIGNTMVSTLRKGNLDDGLINSLVGATNLKPQVDQSTGTDKFVNENQNEAPLYGEGIAESTGKYMRAAIYTYPEALNIANYTVSETTGSDLITNGTFTGSADNWTLGSGISFGSNNITYSAVQFAHLRQDITLIEAKKTYRVQFTISNYTAGNEVTVYLISENKIDNKRYLGTVRTGTVGNGTYSLAVSVDEAESDGGSSWFSAQDGGIRFSNQLATTASLTIDDVSLVEITSTQLNITAKEIGVQGNHFTLDCDSPNITVSGPTLSGGKGIYSNQQLTLPEDNIKVLGVRVGTNDSEHRHALIQKSSAVHRGRIGKTDNDSEQKAFRYYIEGNRLNIQHDNLNEITIVYLKYPTDLRGWPMVKEGHETAVAQYIMWQMKLIEFYNGKLPQYITKELEKRWYYLCGKARGDDSMPTSEEIKQIGNMWNTLVPITNDRSSLTDF
jgi:hypothetical protein